MMKWFLIVLVYPPCGNVDCGIDPSWRARATEARVEMPSMEVCRQLRFINRGSRCVAEMED